MIGEFPDFSVVQAVQGLPPHEHLWVRNIAFHPEDGDPTHAEAVFFLWFDGPEATHDEIVDALRRRLHACLEALE